MEKTAKPEKKRKETKGAKAASVAASPAEAQQDAKTVGEIPDLKSIFGEGESAAGAGPAEEEVVRGDVASLSKKWLKNGTGRPTEYQEQFCELALAMGAAGYSKAMIAHELNCSRQTLDNWAASHTSFLDAMSQARELSLGWWEAQGLKGIWAGKEFNAQAYNLQVRNRFPDDWKERSAMAITGEDGGPIKTETNITGKIALDFEAIRAKREKTNG